MRRPRLIAILVSCLTLILGSAGAVNSIRIPWDELAINGGAVQGFVSLSMPAFGDFVVNSPATRTATLSNTKTFPIAVVPPSAASVVGTGFSFLSTDCGATLAAGQSCTVTVELTAQAQGGYF